MMPIMPSAFNQDPPKMAIARLVDMPASLVFSGVVFTANHADRCHELWRLAVATHISDFCHYRHRRDRLYSAQRLIARHLASIFGLLGDLFHFGVKGF